VRGWLRIGLGIAMLAAFVAVFWAASEWGPVKLGPAGSRTPTPQVVKQGNFGSYLYGMTNLASENKKMAQFDPTLPTDDAVIIEVLKALAKDGFAVQIPSDLQPVVETIDETNYITFSFAHDKFLFELFRNSNGRVGTVRFSKEPLRP
jgi:hypothetical protein